MYAVCHDDQKKSLETTDWLDLYYGRLLRLADELSTRNSEYEMWKDWASKSHSIEEWKNACVMLEEQLDPDNPQTMFKLENGRIVAR